MANQKFLSLGETTPEDRSSILDEIHAQLRSTLEQTSVSFGQRTEEDLFECAKTAQSNQKQSYFFEALREFRSRQNQLINDFLDNVDQNFANRFYAKQDTSPAPKEEEPTQAMCADDFQLIDNDELEQSVALRTIIAGARERNQEALQHMCYRLNFLLQAQIVNEDTNPLDPAALLEAFRTSSEALDLEVSTRIVLYENFARFVLHELQALYEFVNDLMIQNGILPEIRRKRGNSASRAHAANDTGGDASMLAEHAGSGGPASTELMSKLGQVYDSFLQMRQDNLRANGMLQLGQYARGPQLAREELVQLLGQLQTKAGHGEAEQTNQAVNILPSAIQYLFAERFKAGKPASLPTTDESTINLVSMFFDFVLDDSNLPVQMQILLSRLQIPVLKIALQEQGFLAAEQHPVRTFINEMADASYGRADNNDSEQEFYSMAGSLVQQLLSEQDQQGEHFTQASEQLRDFLAQEARQAEPTEKRSHEAASAEALRGHIDAKVQVFLDEKIEGVTLPLAVREFLQSDWKTIMVLCHLKFGEESAKSLAAAQLCDDLIWSVRAHTDQKSLQRLQGLLPELYRCIKDAAAEYLPLQNSNAKNLSQIKHIHKLILDQDFDALSLIPTRSSEYNESSAAAESKSDEEGEARYEHVAMIRQLAVGQWLRLRTAMFEGGRFCRISARIDTDDSLLLVNRFGVKVAKPSVQELAHMLQARQLEIIEDIPLFEQAISSISERMRSISGVKN